MPFTSLWFVVLYAELLVNAFLNEIYQMSLGKYSPLKGVIVHVMYGSFLL